MPVDPSIPLSVQNPQINLGAILEQAAAFQQIKRQNMLRQTLAEPDAIDPKTGDISKNALAKVMQVDPQAGMKLIDQQAQASERRTQRDHLEAETQLEQQKADAGVLSDSVASYKAALKDGNTDPKIAEQQLRKSIHDHIYSRPYSKERNDADWGRVETATPAQLDALSMTAEQRFLKDERAKKVTPYFDPKKNETVFVGAEAGDDGKVSVKDQSGKDVELEGPITKGTGAAGGAKPQLLMDKDGTNYIAYIGAEGTKPRYTDMQGQPYEPKGAAHIAGGQGRSGLAMAMGQFAKEHPDATAEDFTKFAANYAAAQITGTAGSKSTAAGMGVIAKTRASVEAAEGNANREADLVLSLVDKGGGALPRWINKPLQDFRVQGMGSTDAAELRTALESFKNEYVKVLSTQAGVSGGMASDAARREADSFINDGLSIEQIKHNIGIMKKSMGNRSAALDAAYETESARLKGSGDHQEHKAPKGADGSHAIPPKTLDQWKHIPESRKAEAKARLKKAGYDVSELN